MPQSGAATSSARRACRAARGGCASATVSGDSTARSSRSITPRMIRLPGSVARIDVSSLDCAVSIEICVARARPASSGRNEYAVGPLVDDRGVAEADVDAPSCRRRRRARGRARRGRTRGRLLGRACMYGSSICTMSAPAANRSTISSWTAAAYARASSPSARRSASFCACCDIVNGPGTVILIGRLVFARRNCTSRTCTGCVRRHRADHARHRVRVAAAVERRARVVDVDARRARSRSGSSSSPGGPRRP